MKNGELLEIFEALTTFGNHEKFSTKTRLSIAKNLRTIRDEVDALQEARRLPPKVEREFTTYQKKRQAIITKWAKGNPKKVLKEGGLVELADPEACQKELKELDDKYRSVLTMVDKRLEEWREVLKSECSISPVFHKIKESDLPEDGLNVVHLTVLLGHVIVED